MKNLKLILNFYRSNLIASIILLIITCVSIFFCSMAFGKYRYITYSQEIFQNSGLENAWYYMPTGFDAQSIEWSLDTFDQNLREVQEALKSFPIIRTLIMGPKMFDSIKLYDVELQKAFPVELIAGKQLDETSNSNPESPDGIDGIVCGIEYKDVKLGDTITSTLYHGTKRTSIKVHVIGKASYLVYIPNFNTTGSYITSDDMLLDYSGILCRESPELLSYLYEHSTPMMDANFFIDIKDTAREQEKSVLKDLLEKSGTLTTYDAILNNSKEYAFNVMKDELTIPLFFLFVSSISLITISILFVYKNIKTNSVYYLCGCSRKKGFFYIASGIGMISIAASIPNIILIHNMNFFIAIGIFSDGYRYRFDSLNIWFIILYIFCVLVISIGIPYFVYRKLSPIELYRRVQ